MIKDIIIHVWGEAEREPFGHTSRLEPQRSGDPLSAGLVAFV